VAPPAQYFLRVTAFPEIIIVICLEQNFQEASFLSRWSELFLHLNNTGGTSAKHSNKFNALLSVCAVFEMFYRDADTPPWVKEQCGYCD
jgi:hypothetical protein